MNKTIKFGDIVYAMILWIFGGIIYSIVFSKDPVQAYQDIFRDTFNYISLLVVFRVIIWVNSNANKVE